jgi:hypothetical protein
MNEEWRSVPGFEGSYEVSDLGRVRSLPRLDTRGRKWKGKILSTNAANSLGHHSVMLYRGSKWTKYWLHRLVLAVFVGPADQGAHGCHKNGDVCDNRLDNLLWGTAKENAQHKYEHGTNPKKGEASPFVRYSRTDFERVRDLRRLGVPMPKIAKHFGMSTATVHKIEHGQAR